MKKLLVICVLFTCTASFAAVAASQYFIACNKVWKIDAKASNAEVLYWMDVIEAGC